MNYNIVQRRDREKGLNEASHANSSAPPAGHNRARNPGVPLDVSWFEPVGVNASAVERRTASLVARRSVKKEYQAAWLVRAVTCLDLTTLSGDDTPGRVRRLCAKARRPLDEDIVEALDLDRFAADRRRGLRLSRRWSGPPSRRSPAPASPSPRSPRAFPPA